MQTDIKLERLDFKEITLGKTMEPIVKGKVFVPSHTKKEEPPPPPPPPTFSEAQMRDAEREGYKKGFPAGEKEGYQKAQSEQAEINRQLAAMTDTFAQSVAPMFEHYRQMVMQVQKELPAVAMAIARKVAGNALDTNAANVISDVAMQVCETMIAEPELTIVTHESLADTLEQKIKELAVRLPAATQIIILRDPNMPKEDCRIEWKNGSLARVTTELWAQMEKALANMAVISERETREQMDQLQTQVVPNKETPSEKE